MAELITIFMIMAKDRILFFTLPHNVMAERHAFDIIAFGTQDGVLVL